MTFKDLIRLLRRRWLQALTVATLCFAGFWTYSISREQAQYRARARVMISTPPVFASPQTAQWISFDQRDTSTWVSIITGRDVQALARKKLEATFGAGRVRPDWLASVRAVPEGPQLTWIETTTSAADTAAHVANAFAQAAEEWSYKDAGRERDDAILRIRKQIAEERALLREEEFKAGRIREEAKTTFGSENLEADVRHLQTEIQSHEVRRRELDRKTAAHRLRLERIRSDRTVAEHLQRDTLPRLPTASAQARLLESGRVRNLIDRLEILHRELHTLNRRYTPVHPAVRGLRDDIREAELELTREQFAALGRDMDAEEISLRSEIELMTIETRVLDPELRDIRERLGALSPRLDQVRSHERLAADAKTRADQLDSQRNQLENTPLVAGYVRVMDQEKATPDEAVRIEPRLRRSWPIAFVLALILGISFAFLVDFLDTSIRNDYDVRRHLDYPVLAVVPRALGEAPLTIRAPRTSMLAEIFDTLATILLSTPSDKTSRVFLVTSTNPEEGKTSVSTNLAVALARQGKRTLLIDGDMRIPTIHTILGLPNDVGLSELLAIQTTLDTPGLLRESEIPNLKVLTSGVCPENPYELLDPGRLAPLLGQIREQFEAIVIDTPPVLRTGDALKFSSVADSVLFVVEAARTEQRQATWAKRLLVNVGAKVAGVVLNRAIAESEEYYYYYGGSRGGGRKESRVV